MLLVYFVRKKIEIAGDTTKRVREKRKNSCAGNTIVLLENKSSFDPLKCDAFHLFDQCAVLLFAISPSIDRHLLSINNTI